MNFDPFLSKTSATETALNQPGLGGKLYTAGRGSLCLVGLQILSSSPPTPPPTPTRIVRLRRADLSWGISVLVFLLSFCLSFIGDRHLVRLLDLEERDN